MNIQTLVNVFGRNTEPSEEAKQACYDEYKQAIKQYWKVFSRWIRTDGMPYSYLLRNESPSDVFQSAIKEEKQIHKSIYRRLTKPFFRQFKTEGLFNINSVLQSILYLSEIRCGTLRPSRYLEYDNDSIYPLLNHTGQYQIEEYMYALANNVILSGIPSRPSEADGELLCPIEFYDNNLAYNKMMEKGAFKHFDEISSVYDSIMELPNETDRKISIYTYYLIVHSVDVDLYHADEGHIYDQLQPLTYGIFSDNEDMLDRVEGYIANYETPEDYTSDDIILSYGISLVTSLW